MQRKNEIHLDIMHVNREATMEATVKTEVSCGEDMEHGQKRSVDVGEDRSKNKRRKRKNYSDPKNALILLNELRTNLHWTLIGQDGPHHDPNYSFQVEFDGKVFTGTGNSKQMAKHNCAENALKSIVYSPNGQNEVQNPVPPVQNVNLEHPKNCTPKTDVLRNPIMILNELSPALKYDVVGESGDAHDKSFTVRTSVPTQTGEAVIFQGIGRNKRLAKARAAQAALEELFNLEFAPVTDEGALPVYTGSDEAWQMYRHKKTNIEGRDGKNPVQEVHELYRGTVFQFQEIQQFPLPITQCSIEIEGKKFEATDCNKKQAKFLTALAAIQFLKDTGLYEERRAQKAVTQEEKRKHREFQNQEWRAKYEKTKEERASKPPPEGYVPRPQSILSYFYKRFKKARFNLRSGEGKHWEMSVLIDNKLFLGTGQSDQAAKRAAAQSVLRYQVEIGAITDDITELLNRDPNQSITPMKVPVEGIVDVKKEEVKHEHILHF